MLQHYSQNEVISNFRLKSQKSWHEGMKQRAEKEIFIKGMSWRGSPICDRVHKKILEYFKNNVPQFQIAKSLQISSTVHNIIKGF